MSPMQNTLEVNSCFTANQSAISRLEKSANKLLRFASRCWDSDSAHSSCAQTAGPRKPDGQCYVTAMLVAEFVALPRIATPLICRGSVHLRGSDKPLLEDHGWVEWIIQGRTYLTDLTIHQVSGLDPILLSPSRRISLDYHIGDRRRLEEVVNEDAWMRYFRLSRRYLSELNGDQPCLT